MTVFETALARDDSHEALTNSGCPFFLSPCSSCPIRGRRGWQIRNPKSEISPFLPSSRPSAPSLSVIPTEGASATERRNLGGGCRQCLSWNHPPGPSATAHWAFGRDDSHEALAYSGCLFFPFPLLLCPIRGRAGGKSEIRNPKSEISPFLPSSRPSAPSLSVIPTEGASATERRNLGGGCRQCLSWNHPPGPSATAHWAFGRDDSHEALTYSGAPFPFPPSPLPNQGEGGWQIRNPKSEIRNFPLSPQLPTKRAFPICHSDRGSVSDRAEESGWGLQAMSFLEPPPRSLRYGPLGLRSG